MTIKTPLDLRWERAKSIEVKPLGDNVFEAPASDPLTSPYRVTLCLHNGHLTDARCTCADYDKMYDTLLSIIAKANHLGVLPNLKGIPMLHGTLVCKHILAAANHATKQAAAKRLAHDLGVLVAAGVVQLAKPDPEASIRW